MKNDDPDEEGEFVCKCECGGNVLGVRDFGRLWTWCDTCTPVVKVDVTKLGHPVRAKESPS